VASGLPEAAMCVQDIDAQCVLQFTLIHAAGCARSKWWLRNFFDLSVCKFFEMLDRTTLQQLRLQLYKLINSATAELPVSQVYQRNLRLWHSQDVVLHRVRRKWNRFMISLTLSNLNRYSRLFHCWKAQWCRSPIIQRQTASNVTQPPASSAAVAASPIQPAICTVHLTHSTMLPDVALSTHHTAYNDIQTGT